MDWETTFSSGALSFQQKQPYLEILVQPQTKFRFRYRSEMTGKHGSLLGAPQQQQSSMLMAMRSTSQLTSGSGVMYPAPGSSSSSSCTNTRSYGISDSSCCSVSGHLQHVEGSSNIQSSSGSIAQMQGAFASNNGSKLYPTVKVSLLTISYDLCLPCIPALSQDVILL